MLPILQIGPLAIQTPGVIILLGLWLGLNLSEKYAKNNKANPNDIYNLVFIGLISGLSGARLAYIFLHLDTFAESPISIISLNPGLLDPSGGAAIGLIAILTPLKKRSDQRHPNRPSSKEANKNIMRPILKNEA